MTDGDAGHDEHVVAEPHVVSHDGITPVGKLARPGITFSQPFPKI
jgi:hypothetical protein